MRGYVRIHRISLVYGYGVSDVAKSVTMVRLDDDLKRLAKEQAEREGRSLSSLLALAARFYLQGQVPTPLKFTTKPKSSLNSEENS